jgi:hypothetical protein
MSNKRKMKKKKNKVTVPISEIFHAHQVSSQM